MTSRSTRSRVTPPTSTTTRARPSCSSTSPPSAASPRSTRARAAPREVRRTAASPSLGVPCNQFGGQEPGTRRRDPEFCSTTYGVTFPLTEKIDVNGDGRHALYQQLADTADAEGHTGDIRWNFEKFLIAPGRRDRRPLQSRWSSPRRRGRRGHRKGAVEVEPDNEARRRQGPPRRLAAHRTSPVPAALHRPAGVVLRAPAHHRRVRVPGLPARRDSSLQVGLLSLAQLGPVIVCSFLGGALADAVDRRKLLHRRERARWRPRASGSR